MNAQLEENKMKDLIKKGTTTVGIVCKDGVILAADQRVSMGNLNVHKITKIEKITDNVAITMAGSVGDNQLIIKYLRSQMELWTIRRGKKPSSKACATLLANILAGGKGYFPFYVQMLLAGYDEDNKGHLFSLGPDGSLIEDNWISTGSGSVFAYGILDEYLKDKMLTTKEAIHIAVKAINAAIRRDLYTGEGITVFVIDKKGVNKLSKTEIEKNLKK